MTSGRRLTAAALSLGLLASACGSSSGPESIAAPDITAPETSATESTVADDSGGDATTDEADEPAAATEQVNLFPSTGVVDLATKETVDFSTQAGGGTLPVLLWFWAPH